MGGVVSPAVAYRSKDSTASTPRSLETAAERALRRLEQALAGDRGPRLRRLIKRPGRVLGGAALRPLQGQDRLAFPMPARMFWGESMRVLDMGPRLGGYSSFAPPRLPGGRADATAPAKVRVATVTLDDYTRGWPVRPTFIKIDAESAEAHVFAGMAETLERLRPAVAFEVGDFELSDVPRSRDLILAMARSGYAPYRIRGGRLRPHEVEETYSPESIVALPEGHPLLSEVM